MPPKTITYQSYENFTEEQFQETIRPDFSYIEGGNLTSLQHVSEKRLDQFAPLKKIVLRGNNKPQMTSQLRKAIMKRSRLKNKANKSGKPANKTAYKTQRNLVVKSNKETKKIFPKKSNNRKYYKQTKNFWKLYKPFFTEKGFHYKQKCTLKTKRGVTSGETTIANIFNNHFVNITKSLNIPSWNPENPQKNTDLEKIWEKIVSHPSVRHKKRSHLTLSLVFNMYYHGKRTKLLWN